jgi:hypothetical protein
LEEFLEAINILRKYKQGEWNYPFNCSHDKLSVCGVDPGDVTQEDIDKLDDLGFFVVDDYFASYRFGSC